jgi:hypothetical protein
VNQCGDQLLHGYLLGGLGYAVIRRWMPQLVKVEGRIERTSETS